MQITILIAAVAGFSWLVVVGLIALAVARKTRGKNIKGVITGIVVAFVAAVLLNTVSAGLVFIEPQERGVVISAVAPKGYREEILQPGLRWVVPYAENVKVYPISKMTYTMSIAHSEGQIIGDDSISARTSDGQEIIIDASVMFSLNPSEIMSVHIDWQDRYIDDLIRPSARGVIREAVAQFKVSEVYSTKRAELAEKIESDMAATLEDNGLILSAFVLRNITFTDEYSASIEQKQIAEQKAEEAEYVVEQKKFEADQAREEAKGQKDAAITEAEGRAQSQLIEAAAEAEALRLIAEVLAANPELLNYRYIEKLAPGIQVMLVPNDNPYFLPLPDLDYIQGTPTPETGD
ncbi:MAG: hypothetical protein B6I38_01760 [Anaerolineaceae bacterium 4572_5.1]|nr:MAG: hypothetical protein B6I38_01760 [Anaerolineaceae bacterium 4572_5.1]RLD04388.1 MAG: hypothetical protein DRI56_11360 [Chloroflexota bacterium]